MISRLQFMNKINLIPNQLLVSKKSEDQVNHLILEFLTNDAKYGYLTIKNGTIPSNDMYPCEAQTRMQEFNATCTHENDKYEVVTYNISVFGMPKKVDFEKVFKII